MIFRVSPSSACVTRHTPQAVALGLLVLPMLANADGYSYPIAVEREPAVQEDVVTLGASEEAPETLVPLEAAAAPEAPATPAAPAQQVAGADPVRVITEPQAADLNGGTASAGVGQTGRTLSLYATDKSARVEVEDTRELFGIEDARVGVGVQLSELRDIVVTGTGLISTLPGLIPNVELGVGGRTHLALLGEENGDVFGVGVGARGVYELPLDAFPLSIAGNFFYTPDILAFGAVDRILDFGVDAGIKIRDNLSAFVGFRLLQFDTQSGRRNVEDDIHIGVTWQFGDSKTDDELL